jgi:hypothetical protein
MIERESGHAVFDVIGKALQTGDHDGAARSHGFERGKRECLTGLGQTRIDEDSGAPIRSRQGLLVEDRAGELAGYGALRSKLSQFPQVFVAVAALLDTMRTDNA